MEIKETTIKTTDILVKNSLEKATSYEAYRDLVAKLVTEESNTGEEQTEALAQYTLLNNSRMRRLDKTTRIPEPIEQKFKNYQGNLSWLVLTESWCGDAAQAMPAMNKLAELNDGIDFKVILRDENLELMDAFLTNGSRSIPKLIIFDNDTNEIVNEWGPRPTIATKMVKDYKEKHGVLTPEFKQDLQVWYNKDKSQNVLEDLNNLID